MNGNARRDAREHFGFRVQDILECVLALREAHFTRSNLHNKKYGIWVDHYQIIYEDEPVYLHFYVEGDTLVINSFKRDDEA